MKKNIIVITGPTASGKTKLAVDLALKINAEIIYADSRAVYKDFDIVSAKPDELEKKNIPHHLIDILDPDDDFSAGDFVNYAKKIIDSIDKPLIITGGSWFYIKSLFDDKALIECPSNNELRKELSKLDKNTLWQKLYSLDEKRAKEIHPNNIDKVIRSIEMCLFLNSPVSLAERKDNFNYNPKWFMPKITREKLYENINLRVDKMIETGLYEEWKKNKEKYPNSKVIYNTIGYKEFFDLEKGIYNSFNSAVDKIKQHTRNFAKRQLTYFKSRNDITEVTSLDDIISLL